jgi:23S rRNA pseudouridine2605 synthase
MEKPLMMRINKFIATYTETSRRQADELIKAGQVFINGKKLKDLGQKINPEEDEISIKDKKIIPYQEKIYLMLNKPPGYVTTRHDEKNRKTVMDLIPKNKNLKPVGRLDKDTEGLLLFSNDGEFINEFTHPKFECKKIYLVKILSELSSSEKLQLEKGIEINGEKTYPAKINIVKKSPKKTILKIQIHEGKNRQIRKMFSKINHNVEYLKRLQIGKLSLGSLKKGTYKILTKKDLNVN